MQTVRDIRHIVKDGCELADWLVAIKNIITNTPNLSREDIERDLNEKFTTVITFERKRNNLLSQIDDYGKKLHFGLKRQFNELKAALAVYEAEADAMCEPTGELKEHLNSVLKKKAFTKKRKEALVTELCQIKNIIMPLYEKACEINRLVDEFNKRFLPRLEKSGKPPMGKTGDSR